MINRENLKIIGKLYRCDNNTLKQRVRERESEIRPKKKRKMLMVCIEMNKDYYTNTKN